MDIYEYLLIQTQKNLKYIAKIQGIKGLSDNSKDDVQ